MHRLILITSAAIVLLASGVVHGLWTDRWVEAVDFTSGIQRLHAIPMTIGEWQGKDVEMPPNPRSTLAGSVARRYVHAATGKAVTLYLAVGKAGPVCVHTPDVCYQASGYEIEKPARFTLGTEADAPEFLTSRFVLRRNDGQTTLRIFWSWHGSKGWRVADNPRLSFAGERTLHKLYVIRDLPAGNEPAEGDPCADFLRELVPVLDAAVFSEPR